MSGGGALGLGKSSSSNQSTGMSESGGYSTSNQQIAYSDLYNKLYSGATGAADQGVANGAELGTAARDLFTGGTNFLDSLSGGNAGTNYEASRLNGSNPALDSEIASLGADTGRFLTENALPQIASNSVGSGTLGNDRQGIAEGTAIGAAAKDFMSQAATLRANDVSQRDTVAANIAGQTVGAASTGLGALPSMMDLLTNSSAPELGIYANLAKVLGGPTTLTQQFSQNFSKANQQSSGQAHAWNFNIAGEGGAL